MPKYQVKFTPLSKIGPADVRELLTQRCGYVSCEPVDDGKKAISTYCVETKRKLPEAYRKVLRKLYGVLIEDLMRPV